MAVSSLAREKKADFQFEFVNQMRKRPQSIRKITPLLYFCFLFKCNLASLFCFCRLVRLCRNTVRRKMEFDCLRPRTRKRSQVRQMNRRTNCIVLISVKPFLKQSSNMIQTRYPQIGTERDQYLISDSGSKRVSRDTGIIKEKTNVSRSG